MQEKYIVYFISKIKKKMLKFIQRQLNEKNLHDLVPAYGNILTILYDHKCALSMKSIGELLGKEKSTITTTVNKLEKLGYVSKVKSVDDKRNTFVCLTDKGRSIETRFDSISKEVHDAAYNNFTNQEKQELLRLLKKLNQNFD